MKNIQIIDGAMNATFSVFQATEEEFAAIFPDGRDMELAEDLFERLGEEAAGRVLTPLWNRPILKRDALGIHGTLFYNSVDRRFRNPSVRSTGTTTRSIRPRETCSRDIAEPATRQFVDVAFACPQQFAPGDPVLFASDRRARFELS
jgi:hypothetical protein